MLPLITTALSLLKFVPDVLEIFDKTEGEKKTDMAQRVVNTALRVATELKLPATAESVDATLAKAPMAQIKFKQEITNELDVYKAYIADVQHAREQTNTPEKSKTVATAAETVLKFNLPFVGVLIVVQVFCMWLFEANGALLAVIGNIIGLVIGQLLDERIQVLNYLMGAVSSVLKKPEGK